MIAEKINLDQALIAEIAAMHRQGVSVDRIIEALAATQTPKPFSMLVLRHAGVLSLGEAKIAVHEHPAYAYRREADEAFHEEAIHLLDDAGSREHEGSAAA